MKNYELRLFNRVLIDGSARQVEMITKSKIGYHKKPNEDRMHYVRICEVRPVPITKELLTSIGFEEDSNGYYRIKSGAIRLILIDFKHHWQMLKDDGFSVNTFYVNWLHELQNIYYYITSKELKV